MASSSLDRLPCGWLSMDVQGTVLAVNATLCRLLEGDAHSLVGKPFDSLLTRPSGVLYQSFLQPLLHLHGDIEEFSLAFDLGAGRTFDAMIYSTTAALGWSQATPQTATAIELIVVSHSKRRGIEDQMLRIKRAADHAPGMIFQLMQLPDGSCRFPYTSEAIRHMYGVTSQQASESAERLFCYLDTETRATLSRSLRAAAQAECDWQGEFEVTLPGAPVRWHEAQATPRRLANGVTLWHGHCADVTDKRALEAAAADKLSLQRTHQARSDFLARVSHELRTPLNGILGFAQLLATDKAENLSAVQRDRLGVLISSGRHLLALVNEVLEVTSIEAGQLRVELQSLELRPLLDRATQVAKKQADKAQVQLLPLNCPDGLWIRCDEQRLNQILANLLSNAIKYNRPSGTVQLVAQGDRFGVHLEVIDSGKGMSTAQCAELFQPFNRLGAEKTTVTGNGLGLVITKQLLSIMGGSLTVRSELGQGSVFSVLMPAGQGLAATCTEPIEATRLPAEGTSPQVLPTAIQAFGRVLYVEDDNVSAILMAAVLGMRPLITLEVATTGAQALEVAQGQLPELLLIDMHLPDTNGIELLAALRNVNGLQSVPAIMVSAGARQQDIDRALACGFVDYWTKPLEVGQALTALDSLLGLSQPAPFAEAHRTPGRPLKAM
jgi:signal transduction histidine kinase/ActR/RegA family two-component response regulator